MNKVQINTLDTLETVKDYYEIHLFDNNKYGGVFNKKRKRYLKPVYGKGKDNYIYYNLMTNDKPKKCYLHRLIALVCVDGYKEGYFVDHLDGNKLNNSPINLEWVSHKVNTQRAVKSGAGVGRPRVPIKPKTYKSKLEISQGANNGRKQLTYDDVTNIFDLYMDGFTKTEIAREIGVSQPAISQIIAGKRWADHPASVEYREAKIS